MATKVPPLRDEQQRHDAIHERQRNVVVDAGPGTGKTSLIIERVLEMVAPTAADVTPIPLERLAVLTFTRRAAGELRYRLRQKLLDALRHPTTLNDERTTHLRDALGAVDTAHIGTIHGFADRLLRLRPIEAHISPRYEIAEDAGPLVRETFDRLLHAADTNTITRELGPRAQNLSVPINEIEETIRVAQQVGLRMQSREATFGVQAGLDMLVGRMIETRDVDYLPPANDPDIPAIRKTAATIVSELRKHPGTTRGEQWLLGVARQFACITDTTGPAALLKLVHETIGRVPDLQMKKHFAPNKVAWTQCKSLRDKDGEWRQALLDPLQRWLGASIVRLREAAGWLYERVKEEHGQLDQLDLLIRLRDLLRDNREVRRYFQGLFDHVFIDEFQDTDPLQCEIAFFLAEESPDAANWRTVKLRPGKLTIVGDPKQSIYRFRRADVAMYAEAHTLLMNQNALPITIETNFRSRPALIDFYNHQFAPVLGEKPGNTTTRFDPDTGEVFYEPISSAATTAARTPVLHVVPYAGSRDEPLKATGDGRAVEAEALARYVSWLVERSGFQVRDPDTGAERPIRFGDVAVLAHVTINLGLLLRAFDRLGIQYTAHGGVLFLNNPLVQRYVLALRAIADRSDGVAEAALLRPPFFGLDLIDLVAGSIEGDPPTLTAARERREHARAVIRDLRFQRFSRPAIQTALDVIERTALGRTVAVGPNGPQALRTLYEVAFQLGRLATEKGLDYDGVTREMRSWIDRPVHVDPPDASGPDTVRVMTIHQAKGLEFPAVVMWDGFAEERGRSDATWLLSRTGDGIALAMDRFQAELPHGAGLLALDTQLASAERRRLFFVAMTRARDLLVVPEPQAKPGGKMLPKIMEGLDESIVERLELYREHEPPAWAGAADEVRPMPVASDEVGATCETARHTVADGVAIATTPIAVPTAVTTAAKEMRGPEHAVRQEESDASLEDEGTETDTARERARKTESSRYGTTFGSTVHRALQLVLEGTKGTVAEIVTRAAQEYHLTEHVDEAGADVDRALRAIEALAGGTLPGTTPGAAPPFAQVEYPICMAGENGTLLLGSIDLVLVQKDEVVIVDFKTDAPPASNSSASAYPAYRRQLELYAEALETGKLAGDRPVRLGLLFTASGEMAWVN